MSRFTDPCDCNDDDGFWVEYTNDDGDLDRAWFCEADNAVEYDRD